MTLRSFTQDDTQESRLSCWEASRRAPYEVAPNPSFGLKTKGTEVWNALLTSNFLLNPQLSSPILTRLIIVSVFTLLPPDYQFRKVSFTFTKGTVVKLIFRCTSRDTPLRPLNGVLLGIRKTGTPPLPTLSGVVPWGSPRTYVPYGGITLLSGEGRGSPPSSLLQPSLYVYASPTLVLTRSRPSLRAPDPAR